MSNKQLRMVLLGMLGIACLVFVAVCFFGLSWLSSKSQHMVDLKLQSKVLDDQLTSLAQAKKQVQDYSYVKNVAKEVIPNDKDQAQAVLEIFQIAQKSGITLQNISFPASNLGIGGSATHSTSSSALISQAKPVSGIKGLYSIQLTITPEGGPQVPRNRQVTYAKMLNFLSRLEHNQRTAQITQVSINPQAGSNGGADLTFALTTNIFIKP